MIKKLTSMDRTALLALAILSVRYGISGFSGVLANLVVFSFFTEKLNVWYIYAALFGFLAAYAVTFTMHKYWTFKEHSKERFGQQSWLYFCSAVSVLAVNTALLYMFVTVFNIHPIFAQFLSLGVATGASFLFTAQVTFHKNADRYELFKNKLAKLSKPYLSRTYTWILILCVFMTVVTVIRLENFPITFSSDSTTYISTANFIDNHDPNSFEGPRILKPLAPAIILIFTKLGADQVDALMLQTIIGYFALGLATFWFGVSIFQNRIRALTLALIVSTTYPVFRYGFDGLTETSAWALYFSVLAGIVSWHKSPSTKTLWITSLLLLAGVLWKEYAVLAGLVWGIAILWHPLLSWREKFFAAIQSAFLIILPWTIWQYEVWHTYSYSYLNWLAVGSDSAAYASEYSLTAVVKSTFALLLLAWPLAAYGLLQYKTWPAIWRRFFWYMLIPSFGFLLWGWVSSRLFFSLVPLVAPLAVIGFFALPNWKWRTIVVLLIIVGNSILTLLAFDPSIRLLLTSLTYSS
jgi:putative flippase GtrA